VHVIRQTETIRREGGRVLPFSEIRPAMLKLGTQPAHDASDNSMP